MTVHFSDISAIRRQHPDKRIVLTSGTFDLLHVGHLRYLSAVKDFGDIVVVMLSSDARVKARKGDSRPVIPESDRAQMLDALKAVDYVFLDPVASPDETNPVYREIITDLQPDVYVTDGPDARFWNLLDESKLAILPRTEGDGYASTSAIIDYIKSIGT